MPGASSMRGVTGYRISDVMNGALAQIDPGPCAGGRRGRHHARVVRGRHDGEPFVYNELVVGTWGGRPVADGNDGLANPCASIANIPIEVAETEWPIVVERYGLVADSGGAGRYRGGLAIERAWRCSRRTRPCTCAPTGRCTARTASPAAAGRGVVEPDRPRRRRRSSNCRRCSSPCCSRATSSITGCRRRRLGGPAERDPEAVARDVRDERSRAAAAGRCTGRAVGSTEASAASREESSEGGLVGAEEVIA